MLMPAAATSLFVEREFHHQTRKRAMDGGNLERLLKRTSLLLTTISTLSLLYVLLLSNSSSSSSSCQHHHYSSDRKQQHEENHPFPRSSCEAASRHSLSPDRRLLKLRSFRSWWRRTRSLSSLMLSLPIRPSLQHALCVSASPGHAVDALHLSGVPDVTAVDIFDFPPLVSRADPLNLPFFDGVFDLGFTTGLEGALFPGRFAGEMERTVRNGGVCVVVVGNGTDPEGVKGLFRRSTAVGVWNRTLDGSEVTVVVMRRSRSNTKNNGDDIASTPRLSEHASKPVPHDPRGA